MPKRVKVVAAIKTPADREKTFAEHNAPLGETGHHGESKTAPPASPKDGCQCSDCVEHRGSKDE